MGFWGTYLLFCLFSFLYQLTAESPTPKAKKAANAKKGKKGAAVPPNALGAAFSFIFWGAVTVWGQLPSWLPHDPPSISDVGESFWDLW